MSTDIIKSLGLELTLEGFDNSAFKSNAFGLRDDFKEVSRSGVLLDVTQELKVIKRLNNELNDVVKRKDLRPTKYLELDGKYLLWIGYAPLNNYTILHSGISYLLELTRNVFSDIEVFKEEALKTIEVCRNSEKQYKDFKVLSAELNNQLKLLLNKRTKNGISGIGCKVPKGRSLFDFTIIPRKPPVAFNSFSLDEAKRAVGLFTSLIETYQAIRPNLEKFEQIGDALAELTTSVSFDGKEKLTEFDIFHHMDELSKVFKGILITILPYVQVASSIEHIFNQSLSVLKGES